MNLKNKIVVSIFCFALGGVFTACGKDVPVVEAKQVVYHCPMHPRYTSDKPGECPICHMDLVLVETGPKAVDEPSGDRVIVNDPADKEQWIGVRTAVVVSKNLEKIVRAAATVAYDPDLNTVFAEHRELLAARDRAAKIGDAEALARATAMVKASQIRLAQQGLSENQINQSLLQGGGIVKADIPDQGWDPRIVRNTHPLPNPLPPAGEGERHKPGRYQINGKGTGQWVYVQVYENEADLIRPGQKVELTSPALAAPLEATVESVDRIVDAESRTVRVRVSVPGEVRWARMYLEAAIRVPLGEVLAVPKEAVIDTGLRRLVYVQTQPGHYAPQEVVVGRETDDDFEVLDGLMEDDVVAASGQFLIDSESRLRAVVAEAGHAH